MSLPSDRLHHAPVWLAPLIAALIVITDQWLKAWALSHLILNNPQTVVFIPGLIEWQLTVNTGAAWSLFSGSAVILAVGRLLVGLGLLVYLVVRPQNRFLSVVLALIAAGAVGNAIDGIRFGRVTDMIHSPALSAVTHVINGTRFPIFNVADSCVVGGTLLLLVGTFLADRRRPA